MKFVDSFYVMGLLLPGSRLAGGWRDAVSWSAMKWVIDFGPPLCLDIHCVIAAPDPGTFESHGGKRKA